jgi:hypothetical protein
MQLNHLQIALLGSLVLLLWANVGASAACSLQCPKNQTSGCFSNNFNAVTDCVRSIPFREDWRTSTLDTMIASLENFGFRQIMRNSGPPFFMQLDLISDLQALRGKTYASDIVFQDDLTGIFAQLHDAHTRYPKPACYDLELLMPFIVNISLVELPSCVSCSPFTSSSLANEPWQSSTLQFSLLPSVFASDYSRQFPDTDFKSFIGKKIVYIDGLDPSTAISNFANAYGFRSNEAGMSITHSSDLHLAAALLYSCR